MAWTNILLINVTVRHNKLENYIPITTFMIANDPYLQQFVNKFTESGSFYTGLKGLGEIF
jgi:uncharacterized protein with von Willebrand factor type A (vWA) domain